MGKARENVRKLVLSFSSLNSCGQCNDLGGSTPRVLQMEHRLANYCFNACAAILQGIPCFASGHINPEIEQTYASSLRKRRADKYP